MRLLSDATCTGEYYVEPREYQMGSLDELLATVKNLPVISSVIMGIVWI